MTVANRFLYFSSLSEELLSRSNRVRNLIGDAHWLSDGHHKEYVLVDVFTRHLPSGFLASRGFVVSPTQQAECTTEQDILVIDSAVEAPLFHQSAMLIAFPDSVAASLSVKSTLGQGEIADAVSGLATVLRVAQPTVDLSRLWCGAFFYAMDFAHPETAGAHFATQVRTHCEQYFTTSTQSPRLFFAAATGAVFIVEPDHDKGNGYRLRCYDCGTLATTFLLADLMEHLAMRRGLTDTTLALAADLVGMSTEQAGTVRQLTIEGHQS